MAFISCPSRCFTKAAVGGLAVALAVFGLTSVPAVEAQGVGQISGTVTDANGDPVGGLHVGVYALGSGPGGGFVTTTATGAYTIFNVTHSASPYDVQLLAPCTRDQSKPVVVDGNETVNFTVPAQDKRLGYTCSATNSVSYQGTTSAILSGDDEFDFVDLNFDFPYFGSTYPNLVVDTNGFLAVTLSGTAAANSVLPAAADPNGVIAPFWDDLVVDDSARVGVLHGGTSPNRFTVIEWANVLLKNEPNRRVSFEAVLFENGRIVFQYKDISLVTTNLRERGTSATVGIENESGTAAVGRSYNQPYLDNGLAIQFVPAPK